MATTARLVFEMNTAGGSRSFGFNYANPTASSGNVRTAGQALITNGSIYQNPPLSLKSAKMVQTTTTEYDLS